MLACCFLAVAIVALVKARYTRLRALWLRTTGRHVEAAELLEDDYDVRNLAREPVERRVERPVGASSRETVGLSTGA